MQTATSATLMVARPNAAPQNAGALYPFLA